MGIFKITGIPLRLVNKKWELMLMYLLMLMLKSGHFYGDWVNDRHASFNCTFSQQVWVPTAPKPLNNPHDLDI